MNLSIIGNIDGRELEAMLPATQKVWKVRNIKLWNSALHITLAVSVSEIMGYWYFQ
jgi:hypothetical protein